MSTASVRKKRKSAKVKFASSMMYTFLLAVLWTQYTVFPYIRQAILRLPLVNAIADFILPTMIILGVVLSAPHILKRCKYTDVAIYAIGATVVLATWLFAGEDIVKHLEPELVRILVYVKIA